MQTLWTHRYAQRTQRMRSSAIRDLLQLSTHPSFISFAGGLPAAETFPLSAFQDACQHVLSTQGTQALQYGSTEGYQPMRELIARHTARYGITVTPEHILMTSGSQQALDLIGKVFLNPGDRVLVERPTYLGALQAWNAYQAEYVCVPVDADGMQTEALEAALRTGPKFLYALPNFQNPTGATLPLARRLQLIRLAAQYGVPIIEDDPYGQLRYDGEHLTPLVVLAGRHPADTAETPYDGNVLYLSTFSKTLSPGLRLGWIIAPPEVIARLGQAKQGVDLHTSTLIQMIAYTVASGGFLDQHIRDTRVLYRERRDAMLAAMRRAFPADVQWTEPQGGLFIWVTLPDALDASALLPAALAAQVAYVPGGAFCADGTGRNTLRLNFSHTAPDLIDEGIHRLGTVLTNALRTVK